VTEATQNALQEINELITRKQYRSFALRIEILKPDQFVTACMIFGYEELENSRFDFLDYPHALLASFECDIEMWQDFGTRLITGKLDVAGITPPADLSYSHTNDELYLGEVISSPRKTFLFSQPAVGQLFSSKPLVAKGLPPFASLADASARYVHKMAIAHNQTPYERTLTIVLQQSSKIGLVEWLPGELRICLLEDKLPNHQFDIFFFEPNRVTGANSLQELSREQNIPVPSGTTTIAGHLLAPDGDIIQSFVLRSPYTFVGENRSALSIEQQVRADILAGESDIREMKAFYNPDQNAEMRNRVIHSAIAFANTAGGNIYVGVEDEGEFSGNGTLIKIFKNSSSPEEAARQLSAKIRKTILENTRPVIEVLATEIRLGSEWIIRIRVEPSSQIVMTHTNEVFIRSGASNRKPPAEWLILRSPNLNMGTF
jgi:hypothetical protein